MLNLEITEAEVCTNFQDGRRRHVAISSECYQMSNYHQILTKIGTQTKKNMLSSKVTKAAAYREKQKK
jgi:hypothetical protein